MSFRRSHKSIEDFDTTQLNADMERAVLASLTKERDNLNKALRRERKRLKKKENKMTRKIHPSEESVAVCTDIIESVIAPLLTIKLTG